MSALDAETLSRSRRISALSRHRGSTDPQVVELRRAAAEDALVRHIRKVVDAAPPISEETRRRVSALLAPAASARPLDAA